jgi:hypothetical protein
MKPEHLPVPLGMSQGVCLSDPSGLKKLYSKISEMLSSHVPDIDFLALSKQFEALEAEYVAQTTAGTSAGLKVATLTCRILFVFVALAHCGGTCCTSM